MVQKKYQIGLLLIWIGTMILVITLIFLQLRENEIASLKNRLSASL